MKSYQFSALFGALIFAFAIGVLGLEFALGWFN